MNAPSVQGALAQWRRQDLRPNHSSSLGNLISSPYFVQVQFFGGIQVRKAYAADRVSKLRLKLVPATIFTCALGKS